MSIFLSSEFQLGWAEVMPFLPAVKQHNTATEQAKHYQNDAKRFAHLQPSLGGGYITARPKPKGDGPQYV